MANIFISYNRQDEDKTKALVDDIEGLGHTVWFDHELSGGEEWWQKILHSIRDCDIFIFALSNNSLNSTACSLEYKYANALGKTIIPVLVGEEVSPNLLPPALSKIQFIDYRERDRDAVLHLAKAFTTAPSSSALPDPLPQAPEMPLSYLGGFVNQINTTSKLNYDEQIVLVAKLKQSLKDPESTHDAQKLLKSLRKRRDILANIAEEIDELLKNASNKHTLRPDNAKVNKNNGQGSKNKPFWKSQFAIYAIIVAVMIGLSNLNIDEEEKLDNQPVTVFQQPNITKDTKTVIDTTIPKITNTNDDIKDADAWFNKGFGLFSLKRYKEAVAAYDKVIAIDPNDVAAINNKGLALQNLKRYDEAIAAY
ncbi:MAG: TIR domain-containing protein, partial [Thiotrichaceae bacterium]|nr:TIR domain-containing protein [Thiotrichaceae bacterium]